VLALDVSKDGGGSDVGGLGNLFDGRDLEALAEEEIAGGRVHTGVQLALLAFAPPCDGYFLDRGAHNSWIALYA